MSTTPTRVLVVDDEVSIRNLLRTTLESHGFQVGLAESGQMALDITAELHPHVVVLDLGLPDMNGLEVLKRLRAWTTVPILILTVSDEEETKVALLDAGADDYLTKPFSVPELLARIRVAIRTHHSVEATPIFLSGDLEIDVNKRQVKVNAATVKLTTTEYSLLSLLVRHNGKVVPHTQILTEVWGANAIEFSHYLRIYIAQLRKKLEQNPSSPRHILTEPGVGYRLV